MSSATATAPTNPNLVSGSSPPAAIIEHAQPTAESQAIVLWNALTAAENKMRLSVEQRRERGMEFGAACYKLREKYAAQGRRTDLTSLSQGQGLETFGDVCDRLGIVRRSAERWIKRYEFVEGITNPDPAPPAPQSTSSTASGQSSSKPSSGDKPNHTMWEAKPPALKEGMLIQWGGKTFLIGQAELHSDRLVLHGEWS